MSVEVFGVDQYLEAEQLRALRLFDLTPVNRRMGVRVRNEGNRIIEARRIGSVISGGLGESISSESGPQAGATFTNKIYARIQQGGGTIKPKPGNKLLAIPAVDKIQRLGLNPSEFPDDALTLIPRKDKAKPPILIDAETGDVVFWLAPKVTIPDRGPFLLISDATRTKYLDDIVTYIDKGTFT